MQLIVDTSGRLSNNVALNEELKKLKTIISTRVPGGPHETLLVLDGAVGRNGVDQVGLQECSSAEITHPMMPSS